MLVLHGSWLPSQGKYDARFALWGEMGPNTPQPPRRRAVHQGKQPPWHPFAADSRRLRDLLLAVVPTAGEEDGTPNKVVVRLPSSADAPLPSPDLADGDGPGTAAPPILADWRVDALVCEPVAAVRLLLALDAGGLSPQTAIGDDLRYWAAAGRLTLELLYRQRFVPTLRRAPSGLVARWRPLVESIITPLGGAYGEESDRAPLTALVRAMPPSCRALARQAADPEPRPRELLLDFLAAAVDAVARRAQPFPWLKPPSQRNLGETWLGGLQDQPLLHGPWRLSDRFYDEYRAWAEPEATLGAPTEFRVCFRLHPPDESTATAVAPATGAWTLEYLLQATDDPSLLVPVGEVWRRRETTARFLGRHLANPQEHVLAGLGRAARLFPPVEASLRQARPEGCSLSTAEAYDFVREMALLLRADGFGVLVPSLEARLGVRVKVKGKSKAQGLGLLSWDRIVEYDWQVLLGDEPLSRAEFEALARLKEPLVQVRGRWVELRPEQIERALMFFARRAADGEVTLPEAMRLALAPDGEHGLPVVDVVAEGWFAELLRSLGEGGGHQELVEPAGFVGQLRHYQRTGLSWLATLRHYRLGACLADDMGLGKTVQIIALLLHARQSDGSAAGGPALLVCPTSVVGNWRRELARFAPSLRVLVHHGAGREREDFGRAAAGHDVVLSTYALLHRDVKALKNVAWVAVVLDEAQNVKNPSTKAAQAARGLQAGWRAALTGTPVENRLGDLWSIFQFLNPGYLGSGEDFKRRFAEPIERLHDAGTTARLKKLVAPFVLRRLKTDREVIADLPEKNEMKVFCNLTKEQATLYAAVVEDSLRQIEEAEEEGIRRRGVVLATMAKLKQVCDHPALFLKDQSALEGRSGKLARLSEMLEEVLAVDERALVFSQYAKMGELLVAHLGQRFSREVLFLHGGTPAVERDRVVTRFQSAGRGPHLFVLSLKAGGTGLNLTAANHVFHFDRWWNPAVEDQATDRAFRIGQRRDVQVHKFICAGTFEEAIDNLIERKKELAQAIVGAGEAWLTELSTAELRELFALRADAVGDD